jgi:mannose-6-phosphate isomerase-like protein (cupin superfamily)
VFLRKQSLEAIEFGGLRIFDYTAGHELGASMAEIEVPAGATHALAWSKRSDKLYAVVEGSVRFSIDGETADLRAGDFCLVRRGRRFRYANRFDAPARLILVHEPPFDLDSEVFAEEE